MESQRSFLLIALLVVSYFMYVQWQEDYAPVQPAVTAQQTANNNVPSSANADSEDFVPAPSASTAPKATPTQANAKLITVKTDVLDVKISSQGGDIVEVTLLDYETEQGSGVPFTIMQNGNFRYIAQSGLIGAQGIDKSSGRAIFSTSASSYELTDGQPLTVDLLYTAETGIVYTKRFIFQPSSYKVDVEYIINNTTSSAISAQFYAQLRQSSLVDKSSALIPTYRGAAYSTSEEPYEKYDFEDIADASLNETTQGGWVAMLQHYFVSAWVPKADQANNLYTNFSTNKQEAIIGFKAPALEIAPNATATTSATFYVGPKIKDDLEAISPDLRLTVDYGWLFMISEPLFALLLFIQSFVSNWGVAIIIITIIVKGVMYPLTKAQYTSMARMRDLQPKLTQLKERYGEDRQKMSQAMMELYRKEKVNPAGGCLPLLIQMPIFLALYWVFLESVELRHASFGLWLTDLSSKDPLFILPVLMGLSMFIMQKMQPMTIQDPMQQKIMQYMPVAFTVFFFWFPSGLVLYWLVSNVISIIQMKMIFAALEKKKAAK